MSTQKTPIESFRGDGEVYLDVERWWLACPDSQIESYVGIAFVMPNDQVVLLSKKRALALAENIKKAIGTI